MIKGKHKVHFKIRSYVLDNGTRVLNRAEFIRTLGRKGKAKGGRQYHEEFKVTVFLTASNLKKFISKELLENSDLIPVACIPSVKQHPSRPKTVGGIALLPRFILN